MRRNLIIIACIFLGILALMVSGNIIIIGEKIASVTHLWWLEWVFYALLLGIFSYYILLPIWRVHHCPAFPALAVDEEASEEQLRDYGKRLTEHCDFLMVKASPMMDIDKGIAQLGNVSDVYVVAVKGECKELLFLCGGQREEPLIHCQNIVPGDSIYSNDPFTRSQEAQAGIRYRPYHKSWRHRNVPRQRRHPPLAGAEEPRREGRAETLSAQL